MMVSSSSTAEAPRARIDVLIPVWNGADTIRASLESIQRQSVEDIRIIVVDDGSTDATPHILAEMAAADPRILILTKPNGGVVEALNFGLDRCRAEFIARHDADDIAYPERFQRQLDHLAATPDCVAVGAWARHMAADGALLDTYAKHAPPEHADPGRTPAHEPYIMHPLLMARLAAVKAVGGYRYVFHAEDADLYWRLIEIGGLHILPEVLGLYRIHPNSVMSRSILNGRLLSVSSQLAAISAARRSGGAEDLTFAREDLQEFTSAGDLGRMVGLASAPLTEPERRWFEIAVAAKLLIMAAARPYEPDRRDCLFIRRALVQAPAGISRDDLWTFRQLATEAALRLGAKRMLVEALLLYPIRLYPRVLWAWVKRLTRAFGAPPTSLEDAGATNAGRPGTPGA